MGPKNFLNQLCPKLNTISEYFKQSSKYKVLLYLIPVPQMSDVIHRT